MSDCRITSLRAPGLFVASPYQARCSCGFVGPAYDALMGGSPYRRAIKDAAKHVGLRLEARKYGGDDRYSWAVFSNGLMAINGLSQAEVNSAMRYLLPGQETRT